MVWQIKVSVYNFDDFVEPDIEYDHKYKKMDVIVRMKNTNILMSLMLKC